MIQLLRATRLVAALAGCFGIFLCGPDFLMLTASADESRSELILSNLPADDSADYEALKDAAGNPAREMLVMTHSQVWRVEHSRVDAFITLANRRGVTVTRLDRNWNRMLTPYPTPPALDPIQKELVQKTMASKAAVGGAMMELPNPSLLEYAFTKGMNPVDREPPSTLFTPLNDKISVTARRTSVVKAAEGYVWHGVTVNSGEPVTLIWRSKSGLTGTITYSGRKYVVKPMGGDMQGVVEMDPKMLPPDHQPVSREMIRKMKLRDDPLVKQGDASMVGDQSSSSDGPQRHMHGDLKKMEDAPLSRDSRSAVTPLAINSGKSDTPKTGEITITLIVAYTRQAASHYRDIEKDLIDLAVEETNQSFRNSGIDDVRVELLHAYLTDYVESGVQFDDLYRFVSDHDGYMDEIHSLRAQYHANIAILIVDNPHGCGLSAQVAGPPNKAFAVVHHECAALEYSLAHEIGHIIGARHDLGEDDSRTPFPFGHGFIDAKNNWRDIMSYAESCGGCPRLPVWSNPNVRINGVPAGDGLRNNAEVIRERAAIVAGFK